MDISRQKGSAYDMSGSAKLDHVEDLSNRRATALGDSSSRRGRKLLKPTEKNVFLTMKSQKLP